MKFTYTAYKHLIEEILRCGFSICSYHNYTRFEKPCILRHDVDNSIEKALEMALIEHALGVKSTYFVLLSSTFYNVLSKKERDNLLKISALGHEIGLHFDEMNYETPCDVKQAIYNECDILSKALDMQIKSVSMHRPSPETLTANYTLQNIINSYGDVFFKQFKYISDSRRQWRENPFDATKQYDKLHVLTHAFWYHDTEKSLETSVATFVNSANRQRYYALANNIRDLPQIMQEKDVL